MWLSQYTNIPYLQLIVCLENESKYLSFLIVLPSFGNFDLQPLHFLNESRIPGYFNILSTNIQVLALQSNKPQSGWGRTQWIWLKLPIRALLGTDYELQGGSVHTGATVSSGATFGAEIWESASIPIFLRKSILKRILYPCLEQEYKKG